MASAANTTTDGGKSSRNGPTPVIRKLVVAGEDGRVRFLNRQVPAMVISGLIHFVLIATFIVFDRMTPKDTAKARVEPPTTTRIDEQPEKDTNLIDPDPAIDESLDTQAPRMNSDEILKTEDIDSGLPEQGATIDSRITNPKMSATGPERGDAMITDILGPNGSGSAGSTPGFDNRTGNGKKQLLVPQGGSKDTELAVAGALVWLDRQQNKSGGYWEFDGANKSDRVAATGMCLLPFLAAGETHRTGTRYMDTVAKGLNFLKANIRPNGQFVAAVESNSMYSQAIATVALCEAAGMTRDESLKKVARLAVDFIVKAQAEDGSWGYVAGAAGDTSVIGWQIQALKSAKLADIVVTDKAFNRAALFLDSVSDDSGATYGYRTKGATHTLTSVALLSRLYTGWLPRKPELARGTDYLWNNFPPKEDDWNIYYYYYATQVFHFVNGPKWHVNWNPKMQGILLKKQVTEATPGSLRADIGSWPKDTDHIGRCCGKLGTTALACLTLEVYYRHLPLYKRDNGAALDNQ